MYVNLRSLLSVFWVFALSSCAMIDVVKGHHAQVERSVTQMRDLIGWDFPGKGGRTEIAHLASLVRDD